MIIWINLLRRGLMAINFITIKELISYLSDTIEDLEEFQVDEKLLQEDKKTAGATKYFLQTAVEACANIAEHIVFGLHLGNPETTNELFPILAKEDIIPNALAKKLSNAVGLRNILVHQYRKVNLAIVANSATVGLNDLREFAKAISDFIESHQTNK